MISSLSVALSWSTAKREQIDRRSQLRVFCFKNRFVDEQSKLRDLQTIKDESANYLLPSFITDRQTEWDSVSAFKCGNLTREAWWLCRQNTNKIKRKSGGSLRRSSAPLLFFSHWSWATVWKYYVIALILEIFRGAALLDRKQLDVNTVQLKIAFDVSSHSQKLSWERDFVVDQIYLYKCTFAIYLDHQTRHKAKRCSNLLIHKVILK